MEQNAAIVNEILGSFATQFDTATPNQGFGMSGIWPPEGNHACFLTGLTIDVTSIKNPNGQQVPALQIQFEYRCVQPDPTSESAEPLEWRGSMFTIPRGGVDGVTDEKRKTVVKMEIERLRGHLQCIVGRPVIGESQIRQALQEIQQMLDPTSNVALRAFDVFCQYRKGKGEKANVTYKTEFLQKALSTTTSTPAAAAATTAG